MEANVKLGPSDFDGKHLRRNGVVVVLFEAEWCPFCRRFIPIFNSALAKSSVPRAVADLSDFENPLWEGFEIDVVPTIMVFKEGELVYRMNGVLGGGLPESAMDEVMLKLNAGRSASG